jgi:hypothetical protein
MGLFSYDIQLSAYDFSNALLGPFTVLCDVCLYNTHVVLQRVMYNRTANG